MTQCDDLPHSVEYPTYDIKILDISLIRALIGARENVMHLNLLSVVQPYLLKNGVSYIFRPSLRGEC
jgi:hypothetical protein